MGVRAGMTETREDSRPPLPIMMLLLTLPIQGPWRPLGGYRHSLYSM